MGWLLAGVIGFPLLIFLLVELWSLVDRCVSTTDCSRCFRRIPKDAIKKSVPCPECGGELVEGSDALRAPQAEGHCRLCGISAQSAECVELWDGQLYCTRCVEQHAPHLVHLAGSSQLSEDMPFSVPAIARRAFLFNCAVIGGFAAVVAALFAMGGNWQEARIGFGIILLVGLSVAGLWTASAARAMPFLRPKVIAWKGKLIVRLGTNLLVAPLAECSWNEGKLSQMTVLRKFAILQRGAALIVDLPAEAAHGDRAAVGFTQETLDIWKSFFTIAGVPRTPPKDSW